MAELLIYNARDWKDDLTEKQIEEYEKKSPTFRLQYEARLQKGDVIAVYPDGACKEKPSPSSKFIIVKIPDMTVEEGKVLLEESRDAKGDILRRRKSRIAIEELPTETKDQISTDRQVIISKTQIPITVKAESITRG